MNDNKDFYFRLFIRFLKEHQAYVMFVRDCYLHNNHQDKLKTTPPLNYCIVLATKGNSLWRIYDIMWLDYLINNIDYLRNKGHKVNEKRLVLYIKYSLGSIEKFITNKKIISEIFTTYGHYKNIKHE